ncbi:hypothetical protein B0H13DRAFT_2358071 [Mycena leptocephala]|nr:hypothetical protein B0H13DRAFT_2358071 [Mycena leptocephala]
MEALVTKSVTKPAPLFAATTANGASPPFPPKPKPAPPSDERILVRCDGEIPEILLLPYHLLVPKVKALLSPLGLPKIPYASRLNANSVFLAPESKDTTRVGLLRNVLRRLDPFSKIFVVHDSNSHHPLWDIITKTPMCEADFELYDLLVAHALILLTPPDVATHSSDNVIDLGFSSPSLYLSINATVDPSLCVGSHHLSIHYSLDFDVVRSKSTKFNVDKMELDPFLAVLRDRLGILPVSVISSQEQLDDATSLLCELLLAALEHSTPSNRPCSAAKGWWTPLLTRLRSLMRNSRRRYQKFRILSARTGAQNGWQQVATSTGPFRRPSKQRGLHIKGLERIDIFKALNRLKECRSPVFPVICDPETDHEVTVGDVWKFYVAITAVIRDLFAEDVLSFPQSLKDDVGAIVNRRYEEMIEGPSGDIYLAGFYLDPGFPSPNSTSILVTHPWNAAETLTTDSHRTRISATRLPTSSRFRTVRVARNRSRWKVLT